MSEKSEFEEGENLRQFLVQVKRVVDWLHENGEQYGLTERVNDGTVSRALRGEKFDHHLTEALDALHTQAMRDPWQWCEPPEKVEDLTGLPWWHETLKPDVPLNTWNLMRKRPLSEERREMVQALLDDYRARLKVVCDRHAADARLKLAWEADIVHPGYDEWVEVDGFPLNFTRNPWVLLDVDAGRWVDGRMISEKPVERIKRRRAPEGMHTVLRDLAVTKKTSDELVECAARACALQDVETLLPDVKKCALTYGVEPDAEDYEAAQAIVDQALLSGFVDAMAGRFQGDTWDVRVHSRYHPPKAYPEAEPSVVRHTWNGQDYETKVVERWEPSKTLNEEERRLQQQQEKIEDEGRRIAEAKDAIMAKYRQN
ncbi:MAG: hypothetical protein P1U75_05775 [Antarcticimicrobium sp.]|uniref:hypothetical protein n=1 Tax=Antarcticimicrobium sp. TaxID=2824147 RepID=UPI002614F363|nr:hypothetical protein [Antarcticimicrobium sp.]MDF1716166.1 hypothetical protein [Antarcticimicrobium sp.]